MASSSSAQKLARVAARSGGGKSPEKQRTWLFPVAIAVVVAVGLGIVAYARSENVSAGSNDTPPRAQLVAGQPADHWHAAFAINVCGTELPAPQDGAQDPLGIHTHADGLIHIHPFSVRSAGERATMARFLDQVGIEVTDDGFRTQTGDVYRNGETTCAGEPAEMVMAHWNNALTAATSEPDEFFRSDIPAIRFTEDGGAYTLAFVPVGSTDIPAPSMASQIDILGQCDGANPPPECFPDAGFDPMTTPGEATLVDPEDALTEDGAVTVGGDDSTDDDSAPATEGDAGAEGSDTDS